MIFNHYEEFKKSMKNSLACAVSPFGDFPIEEIQDVPDFHSGQRFFVYSMFPHLGAICVEISFPLKKLLAESWSNKDWGNLSPMEIDDTFLELTGMIGGHFLSSAYSIDVPIRFSSPEILFNEFEEDMDTFLGDMMYFHFLVGGHPISIMLSELKTGKNPTNVK